MGEEREQSPWDFNTSAVQEVSLPCCSFAILPGTYSTWSTERAHVMYL